MPSETQGTSATVRPGSASSARLQVVVIGLPSRAHARHRYADQLRTLDIAGSPLVVAFPENSHGVLDDHIESWFVTEEKPIRTMPEGLPSVVGLEPTRVWLDPPKAPYGARERVR